MRCCIPHFRSRLVPLFPLRERRFQVAILLDQIAHVILKQFDSLRIVLCEACQAVALLRQLYEVLVLARGGGVVAGFAPVKRAIIEVQTCHVILASRAQRRSWSSSL